MFIAGCIMLCDHPKSTYRIIGRSWIKLTEWLNLRCRRCHRITSPIENGICLSCACSRIVQDANRLARERDERGRFASSKTIEEINEILKRKGKPVKKRATRTKKVIGLRVPDEEEI